MFKQIILNRKSVYFVSLHKCATSYFAKDVFPKIKGYKYVDYESIHYLNQNVFLDIKKYGVLYGPLKVPDEQHPSAKIVKLFLNPDFLLDKKVIVMVRDPRDLIVSMYYSFGFSHGFSKNHEIRQFQEDRKKYIQSLSIDEYALCTVNNLNTKFNFLYKIIQGNNKAILLRYEDMIFNYDKFINDFQKYIPMSNKIVKQIYIDTRPKESEELSSHKRHGISGGFKVKLKLNTIEELNKTLLLTLNKYGYL